MFRLLLMRAALRLAIALWAAIVGLGAVEWAFRKKPRKS